MEDLSLEQMIRDVAVIGAAGKMGKGIALLLMLEQARLFTEKKETAKLVLVDPNQQGLNLLRKYLQTQVRRFAEKNINSLRQWYEKQENLISNKEIIDDFVDQTLSQAVFTDTLAAIHSAKLIFEAAPENLQIKVDLLQKSKKYTEEKAIFFSNTSSIPIGELEKQSGLFGQLIGFHFYNPPAVQKLLEVIKPDGACQSLIDQSVLLAKRLGKIVVFSADHAGFIGNGHFLQEVGIAVQMVQNLAEKMPWQQAVFVVNAITERWLLRPMGIFQLIDYVGVDIVLSIASVMNEYGDAGLELSFLQDLLEKGVRGGQHGDGGQKQGFFGYQGITPISFWQKKNTYCLFEDDPMIKQANSWLKNPPPYSWKQIRSAPDQKEKILEQMQLIRQEKTEPAVQASAFLQASSCVVEQLVATGVAKSFSDVETVLKNGFYHLYSPASYFLKEVSQ